MASATVLKWYTSLQKFFNWISLFVANTNISSSGDFDIHSFSGGNTPIYISDFVCTIKDDNSLFVLKNRHDDNEKKISLGGLKDYTYIYNYENCQ
jgi:hypothetical protein